MYHCCIGYQTAFVKCYYVIYTTVYSFYFGEYVSFVLHCFFLKIVNNFSA